MTGALFPMKWMIRVVEDYLQVWSWYVQAYVVQDEESGSLKNRSRALEKEALADTESHKKQKKHFLIRTDEGIILAASTSAS